MPGSPEMSTTCPSPSFACRQRRSSRSSSSSRPTSGVEGVADACASKRLSNHGLAQHLPGADRAGQALELNRTKSRHSNRPPMRRRVSASMTAQPGSASDCSRAARFGVSPITACSCAAPAPSRSPTTARPLAMPMRAANRSPVGARPGRPPPAWRGRRARRARHRPRRACG